VIVRARLDNTVVQLVADHLNSLLCSGPLSGFRVRTNTTLYVIGDEIRLVRHSKHGAARHYSQTMTERSDEIEAACRLCSSWIDVGDLKKQLCAELACNDAESDGFVRALLKEQIFETDLTIVLTSENCFDALLDRASCVDSLRSSLEPLRRLSCKLAALHLMGGTPAERLDEELRHELREIPGVSELRNLVQLDSFREASGAGLPAGIVKSILESLQSLFPLLWTPSKQLSGLVRAFQVRFGDAEVPLLIAADPDAGIAIGPPRSSSSPLLGGVIPGGRTGPVEDKWESWDQFLLEKVVQCARSGDHEIELTDYHIEKFTKFREAPSSSQSATYSLHLSLIDGGESNDRQPFAVLRGFHGPSALSVLGRFIYGDKELEARCRSLAQSEQESSSTPLVEIVHASQGRLGNIAARPAGLRQFEVVYGPGDSGCDERDVLKCTDLTLRVEDGRLKLRSLSRDCDVSPRLASAHTPVGHNMPVYQLLAAMQYQDGVVSGIRLANALTTMTHFPRIRFRSLILSPERWLLNVTEIATIADAKSPTATFLACEKLAAKRDLPRFIVLADGDNRLEVDLRCPVSVLAFAGELKGRLVATLEESFREEGGALVTVGGLPSRNEFFIPLHARFGDPLESARATEPRTREQRRPPTLNGLRSGYCLPLDQWISYEIYCGEAMADTLVHAYLAEVGTCLTEQGLASEWFFVRYHRDGKPHVRFRLKSLTANSALVTQRVNEVLRPLYLDGRVLDVQIHTYEREVERYGGPQALTIAERLFHGNSLSVAQCLERIAHAPDKEEIRWKAAILMAADKLFAAHGDLNNVWALCNEMRKGYRLEFGENPETIKNLSAKYRKDGKVLLPLMLARGGFAGNTPALFPRLSVTELEDIVSLKGILSGERFRLSLQSIVHMDLNRMFAFHARANEMVIYEYLERFLRSLIAQGFRLSSDFALVKQGDLEASKAVS